METIEEIIRLREEAIRKLLEERVQLQTELETLTAKLNEISEQLQRLGHQSPAPLTGRGKSGSRRGMSQGEHTVDEHLSRKKPPITNLFHDLSKDIRGFDEGVQEIPHKHWIQYCTASDVNFCGIVIQASKLWVYIDIPHTELKDPQGISEDCSTVGRWATGETRFGVRSQGEVEYAISLIRQAYERRKQLP